MAVLSCSGSAEKLGSSRIGTLPDACDKKIVSWEFSILVRILCQNEEKIDGPFIQKAVITLNIETHTNQQLWQKTDLEDTKKDVSSASEGITPDFIEGVNIELSLDKWYIYYIGKLPK